MAGRSRTAPRFLPTLTEIVQAPAPTGKGRAGGSADHAAIAEKVRNQVAAEMDSLLRDAVATAMLEHVDGIALRLRQEIEPVLRQAVEDMVAHEIAARRRN